MNRADLVPLLLDRLSEIIAREKADSDAKTRALEYVADAATVLDSEAFIKLISFIDKSCGYGLCSLSGVDVQAPKELDQL